VGKFALLWSSGLENLKGEAMPFDLTPHLKGGGKNPKESGPSSSRQSQGEKTMLSLEKRRRTS